jgi:uncharacterized protein (TIGR02453 family)
MPADLKKIRQEIDYSFDELKKITGNKKFKQAFGDLEKTTETSLTRPPKGYEEDNAAIGYLKLKSFIATSPIADDVFTSKDLVKKVVSQFEIIKPLVEFLNRAVEE